MNGPAIHLESELKSLLAHTPISIWTTDANLCITSSTRSKEAEGQTLFEYFQTTDSRFAPIEAHRKALKGEIQEYKLDWAGISYESSLAPLRSPDGSIVGVIGIALDVTERKIIDTQFLASQKMESVGRLASGIAHDFNNILTVILNYAELLEDDLKDLPKAKPRLEAIINCAHKAANLTNQLLAFSKQQVMKEQILDVNILLTSLAHMLTRVIGEDIEFKLQLKENLNRISADPNQIVHTIMMLAHNSREAMKQGGQLLLSTTTENSNVVISIKDTGVGIDTEAQKALFETMKQMGSNITIASTSDKGTTFKIYFPALSTTAETDSKNTAATTHQTILVVEDEDIVRQVACDIIRGSGYHVLEARSALSAIELCETSKEQIDLVLTDLIMPKMNGPELVKRLSLKFPNLNVVYMSGYSSDAAIGQGILKEKASFVQKPFMPKTLIKALQDTLDGQTVAVG
jgi:signal transduction histidine kinase/ActR/RegA family two-component response regulator